VQKRKSWLFKFNYAATWVLEARQESWQDAKYCSPTSNVLRFRWVDAKCQVLHLNFSVIENKWKEQALFLTSNLGEFCIIFGMFWKLKKCHRVLFLENCNNSKNSKIPTILLIYFGAKITDFHKIPKFFEKQIRSFQRAQIKGLY